MKKLLLSFALLVLCISVNAQTSGGPDAFGYIWRNNNNVPGPAYNWVDVTALPGAVQVAGLGDDNTVGFFPIGFQFPYYWYNVSQFKIGSNGYIIFNNGQTLASPFPTIPSAAQPQDFIAPFMADLNFSGAGNPGQCWYWSNSTDSLIISYINVPLWISAAPTWSGANTFQIILSKVDSSITFHYLLQNSGTAATTVNFLSVGIENNSGTVGLQHSHDIYPTALTAVKFYYPASTTFAVNDASTSYCNNPDNGGLFLSKNGTPYTMSAQVANTGNQSLSPFNVNMSVLNISNAVQVTQTLTTTALTPGQTQNLNASNTFNHTTAGTYKFRTTTQLTGDATPSNNYKTQELVVVDTTVASIPLSYITNTVPSGVGISWQGGNAGMGIEIVPPFYPCFITELDFYITANANAVGFYSLLYNSFTPGDVPGTLVDSSVVDPVDVVIGGWNPINFTTPIQIDSGTIFLAWMMGGNGITLGTDTLSPISNRTYEILGGWSSYRSRETQDLFIKAVATSQMYVGENELSSSNDIGQFYPLPSRGKVYLNLNHAVLSDETIFSFYNLQGQLMDSKKINHASKHISFDCSKFDAGVYICKITSGNKEYNRKLIIGK